jgi:hypothetical protein
MRFGVEPDRVRSYVPGNPARGKAQGRIGLPAAAGGCGSQMGVKAQKSNASPKTKSPADRLFEGCTPIRRSVTPTKINRGGRAASKRHVGPEGQKCQPPIRGNKPAKGRRTQERRRARNEGRRNNRPARPWMSGPRSGTPRRQRTRRCMTRTDGTKSKRRRSIWLDLWRA